MKVKKEYLLLVVIIAGLSLYLFTRQTDRTLYQLPKIAPVDGKKLTRIEIVGPGTKVDLSKSDETWTIGEKKYPAAASKVNQMVDTLADLTLTALISESKDYVRYELNDEKKITVKAWAGSELVRDFDIGKPAPSFRHTFVRLSGDPNVYQASDNFRSKFEQDVQDLRDKVVLSFAVSDIQEIRLTRGKDTLVLVRREEPVAPADDDEAKTSDEKTAASPLKAKVAWQTEDGRAADESVTEQLLTTLSQLECEKYISDRPKTDFTDPIYTLQVEGQKSGRLSVFAKQNEGDKAYPAVSSESDEPFLLPEWKAKNLMPALEDVLKKAPPENKKAS